MSAVPLGVTMPFPGHRYINEVCQRCGHTIGGSQESGLCGSCAGVGWAKARETLAETKAKRGDESAFDGVDYGDEPA